MIDVLEFVLSPITWLMYWILGVYSSLTPSAGVTILLLSFTVALAMLPLQKRAQVIELRVRKRMNTANSEVHQLKGQLKGEELFLATEKIYNENGYHPIQSVALGLSFFVMLPVLVSAIFVFTGENEMTGTQFLFIKDLSKPDNVFESVNVLPLLMSAITVIDAKLRFKDDVYAQYRFFFIAFVLLLLVYNLPAGLVLYWIGNNLASLVIGRLSIITDPDQD